MTTNQPVSIDRRIPFDNRLANTILNKIGTPAANRIITENEFYDSVISKIVEKDESFLDIKFLKGGFNVLEEIMKINARNFMIIEMIHRMGYHQFSKVIDEPDEEHTILNYLYNLGKHENRYNNMDKAILAIWSAKWDRYKDKYELIMEELSEKDIDKRDFTGKLLECISYNSSNEALDVISKICRNIQEIEMPQEVERFGGFISSRSITKSEVKNIESHKRKLLIALSKTFRDVINSYVNNYEYVHSEWVRNSESLASLYNSFLIIKEEIRESGHMNDAKAMEGYLSDALYAIIKIFDKIIADTDDLDNSHIILVALDYLSKTKHRQLKNEYLNNVNKIKDKKDLFYVVRLLDQFIENDDDQEIVHEAFNIYAATISLPENQEKIRTNMATQGKIMNTLKRFPNNAKDMRETHKRLKSVLTCLNLLKDCISTQTIFDYADQILGVSKIDKTSIDIKTLSNAFSLLESVAVDNIIDIKKDDVKNENLKRLMESYLQINQHDERLFYQIIKRYHKIYGSEGIEKLLRI